MSKKIKVAVITLLSFLLINCAAQPVATRPPQGERIVFDMDDQIEGWTAAKNTEKNYFSLVWFNPNNIKRDQFRIFVFFSDRQDIDEYRSYQDDRGFSNCDQFETKLLKENHVNNYPSKLWKTECKQNGKTTVKTINLVVKGDGTLYHFLKIWKYDVKDETFNIWLKGFDTIVLCDTRSMLHECPAK